VDHVPRVVAAVHPVPADCSLWPMQKFSRHIIIIFSLLALLAFGAQVVRGIITGTASQCSAYGNCR